MKTLKGKPTLHLLLLLLITTTSCVPDSLTKFKEDGAGDSSASVGEVIEPPSEFVDDEGNSIDATSIIVPSTVSYSSGTNIFVTGDSSLTNVTNSNIVQFIKTTGSFGDYTINQNGDVFSITNATQNNFLDPISNPGFNYGVDLETTYATTFDISSKTGVIKLATNTAAPIRPFVASNANFNFYNPGTATANTITITAMPTISVQAAIPEELSFEIDSTFNCVGTGIGTSAPAIPAIGDTYFDLGECHYNYDGSNTNTVAFPFSGPMYIGLKLNSNSGFLSNDTITSEPFMTGSGAQGTITYKDSTNTIYGTLTSGQLYPGDIIDNSIPFSNTEAIISKVQYYFQPDSNIVLKLINDTSISPATHISFDNSTKIEISPDLPSTLRLVKDVDSPLFGYIIDTSGAVDHTIQEAQEYTVTVENDISERTFKFDIGVVNPPEKLSYSQLVAFKVKNLVQATSSFSVGQEIASSPLPPLSEGANGIVRRILDIDGNEKYLIIQVISGTFQKDSSLDNYKEFLDEEAVIQTEPVSLTHLMKLDPQAEIDFTSNYIATNPAICMEFAGEFARAIVTGNPDGAILNDYLFINQIKDPSSVSSNRDFTASNTNVTDCDLGSPYVMNELWSPVFKGTFSDVSAFISGMDVLTTTNNASLSLSAISAADNTALLQSADGKSLTMTLPAQFSTVRPYALNAATLNDYETLTTFEFQRGVEASLLATLPKGDSVTYSVSPELPPGLTLDTVTGVISGIPEVAAAAKPYTVTATNILGTSTTSFDLLIEDYFEVDIEIDSTPKFYGHKDGQGNPFNKCRIKKRDIVSNPRGVASDIEDIVDIDCYFDIGERDLYTRNLNIRTKSGPGMCHSVEYVPYSFFKRRPNKTTDVQIRYDNTSDYVVQVVTNAAPKCIAAGTTSFTAGAASGSPNGGSADVATYVTDGIYVNGQPFIGSLDDLCTGNYTGGRKCDRGGFTFAIIDFQYTDAVLDDAGVVVTPDDCTNTVEEDKHICGGNPRACLDGPIVSQFGRSDVDDGAYANSIEAFNGVDKIYTLDAPIEKSATSNIFVTNYQISNSCHDGNTDYYADGLLAHANSAHMFDTPNTIVDPLMGAHPFYTFNCLDQADDLLARINVHIRDWDTSFEISNLDKAIIAGDWGMDNSTTDAFGNSVNGFKDWDNYNNDTNYSACGPSTAPTLDTANFVALPITINIASMNDMSFKVQGGLPKNSVYPGMEIQIAGDSYQVKEYDGDEIYVTLPLRAGYPNGTIITGNYLIEFPAYEFSDE